MSLESELKAFARSIGVDHLGIAAAEPFAEEEALLFAEREAGRYPAFAERRIPLRCRPQELLPGARSIISVAISYLTDDPAHPPRPDARPRGWLSRYAWGLDYHPILHRKLEQITAFLRAHAPPPVECRPYVDTGPPLDRAVAARAGLGWFGKNSCIYVPGHGSWVFLAEILTTVPLQPDPVRKKSCGSCDLCLRACPTQAIIAPFRIDPTRCISHLTQIDGFIPRPLRRAIGRRLFGCDVCQAVCPWNKGALSANRPEFRPTEALGARPDLIRILLMTKSEFKQLFGPTPMGWRGKKILQRNAAICLGNIGDPAAVPPLTDRLLRDAKPIVRGHCAWALGEIGGEDARRALLTARASEQDERVIEEIDAALAAIDVTRGRSSPSPPATPLPPPPLPARTSGAGRATPRRDSPRATC
ncbi:MAG TPA: tRNA epoxyqueuosine(34) reductase QueG [Limnochordia bacterium]